MIALGGEAFVNEVNGIIISQPTNNSFIVSYHVDGHNYKVPISAKGEYNYGDTILLRYMNNQPQKVMLDSKANSPFSKIILILLIIVLFVFIEINSFIHRKERLEYIYGDDWKNAMFNIFWWPKIPK
jgi:hypothetical protein